MTLDVEDSIFENLDNQALTVAAGGTGVTTTGTLTSNVTGSRFQNARHFSVAGVNLSAENNVGILVNSGATHVSVVENNVFDNIAEDGTIANTSVIRTQNSGGVMNATVRNNTIQNINFDTGAGGRHLIGHVFEPVAFDAANSSTLNFAGNTATNITFAATMREMVFIDFRPTAGGGNVRVTGNNGTLSTPGSGAQQFIELRFRETNASTINLLVANNTGNSETAVDFIDVDAEAAAVVNATVQNNILTNNDPAPGRAISVATEAAGSTACANITGNTLSAAGGTIGLDETLGTLNVTQASSAALGTANGGATVQVNGAPAFGQPACTLPP